MDKKFLNSSLELWGGIECTINRIDDCYLDQLKYANHYSREGDLELIASLGIKTIRYPLLWEFHQPFADQAPDWAWTDKQLEKLKQLGITPIAGLLHHGSGPQFTNLLDPEFAEKLAGYAGLVAKRYPHIEYFTPVNEPLTTARFSGLYGLWYPHKKNDIFFARMLLNQVKGIVLSMAAIRRINPQAKLVQTEDLGKTYSTPSLTYQAKFENERRWLTYDLLCGKVKPGHSMWGYFSRLGITKEQLRFFSDHPCPPDIMGFNHYITSERYIDENVDHYPAFTHGGNEVQNYADVEAVRVPSCNRQGLKKLLQEAWQRYKMPIAITEAHLNCTKEEQLRWLREVWQTCIELRAEGLDIQAVTAWSLFGAFGWNTLLTTEKMDYEPGAFDLTSGIPRPTILTSLIRALANGVGYDHPVLQQKGWWHRETRFEDGRSRKSGSGSLKSHHIHKLKRIDFHLPFEGLFNPILIIGSALVHSTAGGTSPLGSKTGIKQAISSPKDSTKSGKPDGMDRWFASVCSSRAMHFVVLNAEDLDINNAIHIEAAINRYKPWAILHTIGFVAIEEHMQCPDIYHRTNTINQVLLAVTAKKHGIKFMSFFSSRASELLKTNHDSLIIRTGLSRALSDEDTYEKVNSCLDLLMDDAKGLWTLKSIKETFSL